MIRIRDNEIRPYFTKVILNTTDGEQIIYTDTPSMYEAMVDKFKHIISCKSEPVSLTDDQNTRLEALRALTGELEEKAEKDGYNFVVDGYISPINYCQDGSCAIQPMLKLLPKWEGVARDALLKKYKDIIANARYDKECGGIRFRGMMAFTDKQAQASITSTMTMFQVAGIKSTKFKFMDGWQELDYNGLVQLGVTVATHVQTCFTIEESLVHQLELLPFDQLAKNYKNNPYDTIQDSEEVQDLVEVYNKLVDEAEATMAKV